MIDNGDKILIDSPACPVPLAHTERIVLGHGSGGKLTGDLIRDLFLPVLRNPWLEAAGDSAVVATDLLEGAPNLAVSTDAHVVHPLFFPGGDIGCLSVNGTVNDVAMAGAVPMWISAAFIIEEGFPIVDLERIARSMKAAAEEAGVTVVAGDTKVTEKGKVDGLYITTTGVGRIPAGRDCGVASIRSGDAVLVSGTLGDHGIAVLAARGELAFQTDLRSDTAPLTGMVEAMFASGADIHALRDPTRGGLAASLGELAEKSGLAVVLDEQSIPVRPEVEAASEMLGFDPLHIANEGKLVAFVPDADADRVLAVMKQSPYGRDACRIGTVGEEPAGRVLMETRIGRQPI